MYLLIYSFVYMFILFPRLFALKVIYMAVAKRYLKLALLPLANFKELGKSHISNHVVRHECIWEVIFYLGTPRFSSSFFTALIIERNLIISISCQYVLMRPFSKILLEDTMNCTSLEAIHSESVKCHLLCYVNIQWKSFIGNYFQYLKV